MPRHLALLVAYDGTGYAGFQRQQRHGQMAHLTVQHCLEQAVAAVCGEPAAVFPAGRTDAGVHALGQVVHFSTASRVPSDRLPYALNRHLPPDIVVQASKEVPPAFHARKSAVRKTYRYMLDRGHVPSPFLRRYALHWHGPLDTERMQQAANMLVGRHDFRAFRSTGSSAKTTVRTLMRLAVAEQQQRLVITAEADGFLYNMVRILAGTLLEVGQGRRDLADVAAALATGDRRLAGKTLPSHGLCLIRVTYPEPLWPDGGGDAPAVDNAAFPALE